MHLLFPRRPSMADLWRLGLQKCFEAPDADKEGAPSNKRLLEIMEIGRAAWKLKVRRPQPSSYSRVNVAACMQATRTDLRKAVFEPRHLCHR